MVVPYGFGVGDFIAVGTLAWQVFKATKSAPDSFQRIYIEVLSLRAVLKEAEEFMFKSLLQPQWQKRLEAIANGCASVLTDLQKLVTKYEGLETQSK